MIRNDQHSTSSHYLLGVFWVFMAFTGLLILFSCVAESDGPARAGGIFDQVKIHLHDHPQANHEDAYKFIHQAALGPGHLGVSWEMINKYLCQEWESLESDSAIRPTVDMVDPIVEDLGGAFVRVNLVCYREAGGTLDGLSEALRRSLDVAPDSLLLHEVWQQTTDWLLEELDIDPDSLEAFTDLLREHDWPAVHHSAAYRQAYSPHYRVLERSVAERLLESLPLDSAKRENGMSRSSATSRNSSPD